jgi:hypothetical protein
MKSSVYGTGIKGIVPWLGGIVVFAAVLLLLLKGLSTTEHGAAEEGRRIAEDSVRRAAATCYALEGVYPESFAYIKEHYAVRIDESRYKVFYDIFASNIMPDITVVERAG